MTRPWGVVALVLLAGCVEANLVPCGDLACPSGTVCTPAGCAAAEDAAACAGSEDQAPCMTSAITSGACTGGVCHAIVCGDSLVDPGEVCDDGNTASADGCSGDCRSAETCGNQIVDGTVGEQCDEGIPGLSGDGCSSLCSDEVDLWLDAGTGAEPIFRGAVAVSGPGGHVFTFGGSGTSGFLDQTWEWDGVTWQLHPTYVSPSKRVDFAMAYDSGRKRIVLFGGRTTNGVTFGDTWEWDGVTWILRTPASSPGLRWGMAMAYDSTRSRVVLFGSGDGVLADTWEWDGTTWLERSSVVSPPPGPRRMVFDSKRGRSVLAGSDSIVPIWEWDGTQWTSHAAPPINASHLVYDAERSVTLALATVSTIWEWNGANWIAGLPGPGPIVSQSGQAVAYDVARSTVVAIGDITLMSNSVWELTTAWTSVQPLTGPADTAPRTYDARRGVTVAADGFTGTWEWNGVAWRRVASIADTPPLTRSPKLAYDERRGQTVMFGPDAAFVPRTWLWDGIAWVYAAVSTPPNRINPALAYDASRGVVVLFGGTSHDDTWEWDGASWSEKLPATKPDGRDKHGMAYDRMRERVILFGGGSRNVNAYDDTWEWDGTTWTQLHPTTSPSARAGHGMAYDPQRGRIVVVGRAGDAWELDDTTWTERVLLIPTPDDGSLAQDVSGGLILGASPQRFAYLSEANEKERCVAVEDSDGDGLSGCADPDCWSRCTPLCPPGTVCSPSDPRCGDAVCGPVEDYLICPGDCPSP